MIKVIKDIVSKSTKIKATHTNNEFLIKIIGSRYSFKINDLGGDYLSKIYFVNKEIDTLDHTDITILFLMSIMRIRNLIDGEKNILEDIFKQLTE